MNTATLTTCLRGRAGRRIATTIVAAATLGMGLTACGQGSGAASAVGSASTSTASDSQHASAAAPAQHTSGSSLSHSASQGQSAKSTRASATAGGGVAHAGSHRTLVGKLEYLAPGKLIVKPQGGGMDQAFFVANATKILGAAAICSDDSGSVSIGQDGYGTSKCTVDQLEKAAKTSSVTVRVTMSTKSGAAETVEEKYHP
ncbi:hypothetical protein GCM10012285_22970 [Streptomyces kronopolitis]|uniref:Lipoprotein n=1 Tax=Streptomyces kronopolitis TaxID=1612435 RepID=A0ABQ2JCG0_9ACTN|nr:hypothetical protein [Streptomyces kronopolitis]GGN42525.1 hypothetical protein GCM10012285_22970 [Streptomyces kronopolitis]